METDRKRKQKVVIVGAGPVGSLAALYAASHHDEVEVYEVRTGDIQCPSELPSKFRKSINFTLSERGISAMRQSNRRGFLEAVMQTAIPMNGRIIHAKNPLGGPREAFHPYDINGNSVYSLERTAMNRVLRKELDETPNITMHFNYRFVRADFCARKAWFKRDGQPEIEVEFDFLIGADGVHSAVRYHMMKYAYTDYEQKYVDTRWCELRMPPSADGRFPLSPDQVHLWPGGDFMLVAFPCPDKSFNCTLFGPAAHLDALKRSASAKLFGFFDTYFPGVCPHLISRESLRMQFHENPHLPLFTVKCNPHHVGSSAVILGDAAHAILPFYGQGLNSGLEDVQVLFSLLEKNGVYATSDPKARSDARGLALQEYTAQRVPDVYAIHDIAKRVHFEIRHGVNTPVYRIRKYVEDALQRYVPLLGWQTLHSRVSLTGQRYSEIVRVDQRQGWILAAAAALIVFLIGMTIVRFLIAVWV